MQGQHGDAEAARTHFSDGPRLQALHPQAFSTSRTSITPLLQTSMHRPQPLHFSGSRRMCTRRLFHPADSRRASPTTGQSAHADAASQEGGPDGKKGEGKARSSRDSSRRPCPFFTLPRGSFSPAEVGIAYDAGGRKAGGGGDAERSPRKHLSSEKGRLDVDHVERRGEPPRVGEALPQRIGHRSTALPPMSRKAADPFVPQIFADAVGQHGRVENSRPEWKTAPLRSTASRGLPGAEEGLGLVHVEEMEGAPPPQAARNRQVQGNLRLAAAGGAEKHISLCLQAPKAAHFAGIRHVSIPSRNFTSRPLKRSGCSIRRK